MHISQMNEKLKISDFQIHENKMSSNLRKKMQAIKKRYKTVNDESFLNLFEQKNIFFVADGTDLNSFSKETVKREKKQANRQQIMVDVNRFIIKYDFNVANKIQPLPPNQLEFLSSDSQ